MFFVTDGELEVIVDTESTGALAVATLRAGSFFGEASLFDQASKAKATSTSASACKE